MNERSGLATGAAPGRGQAATRTPGSYVCSGVMVGRRLCGEQGPALEGQHGALGNSAWGQATLPWPAREQGAFEAGGAGRAGTKARLFCAAQDNGQGQGSRRSRPHGPRGDAVSVQLPPRGKHTACGVSSCLRPGGCSRAPVPPGWLQPRAGQARATRAQAESYWRRRQGKFSFDPARNGAVGRDVSGRGRGEEPALLGAARGRGLRFPGHAVLAPNTAPSCCPPVPAGLGLQAAPRAPA